MSAGTTGSWRWVDARVVLAIHDRQLAEHGGADGIRDFDGIESALARPKNLDAYEDPDGADLAAAYIDGLAANHGFVDGNKRTAWVTGRVFLADNGLAPDFDPLDAVQVVEGVAAGRITESEPPSGFGPGSTADRNAEPLLDLILLRGIVIAFCYQSHPLAHFMGKYDPLGKYLSGQPDDSCTLTFPEVEEIIDGPLPASARAHQGWWGNDRTHVQARSWMEAGWKVARHHLLRRGHVHFTRIVHDNLAEESPRVSQVIVRNLDGRVVAELKRRAKRRGRSLEAELRVILTEAARPHRSELIAQADQVRSMTPGPLEDSVTLLRQDRDSR